MNDKKGFLYLLVLLTCFLFHNAQYAASSSSGSVSEVPSDETETLTVWNGHDAVLCLAYKDQRYPKYVDELFAQKRLDYEKACSSHASSSSSSETDEPFYVGLHRDYLEAKNFKAYFRDRFALRPNVPTELHEAIYKNLPPGFQRDINHHRENSSTPFKSHAYLLQGYTGTGKTISAKLCALLLHRPLLTIGCESLMTKWKDSEIDNITATLHPIVSSQDPWVVLFENIDALEPQSVYEFIRQINQNINKNAIIIGTSNQPQYIHSALKERLSQSTFEFYFPDYHSRKRIAEAHLRTSNLLFNDEISSLIASKTGGWLPNSTGMTPRGIYQIVRSIHGCNPILGGRFSTASYVATLQAIERIRSSRANASIPTTAEGHWWRNLRRSKLFWPCIELGVKALLITAALIMVYKNTSKKNYKTT